MKEWEQFLSVIEQELGADTVNKWIRPLRIIRFDAGNIFLEADPIQISWFEEHIRPKLKKNGLFGQNNRPIKIHLSGSSPISKERASPLNTPQIPSFTPLSVDPACTFENFVQCPGNSMAYQLLNEWAKSAVCYFNPIYIYGPKGAGKSHLLMAAISQLNATKKVFFTSADAFTDHVVQAIRGGRMQEFRAIYRNIDVLIVEDIHRLSGRAATQEEFFHTFNTLHTLGKQIVLTSPYPPSKLEEIESRLISRFEWGIAIGIEKAPMDQILANKATLWNLSLSQELKTFFLTQFPSDPILALQALAVRADGPVTPVAAAKILKDLIHSEIAKAITPEKVVKSISDHFGIKPEDLLGKSQSRESAFPRQIAMFVCREFLKMPYQAIGKFFGRDHSTVMSSVKQMIKGVEENNREIIEAAEAASK